LLASYVTVLLRRWGYKALGQSSIPLDATAEEKVAEAAATAVPQLPYSEATIAEWLFPQEKATLLDARKGTYFVEPLWFVP
jgi:hypothetical protein